MSEQPKIVAVVVLYNKRLAESRTCELLRSCCKATDILIVDNSEKDYGNAAATQKAGFRYCSMGGNAGISRAYNVAIGQSMTSDVIVLLDDDTEVPDEYFPKLLEALKNHPDVDIFAPIVIGQDGVIYSPNRSNFLRNELVQDPHETIEQDRFNAIASCLAIRTKVFEKYRFDERLFVDQVDQNFFDDMRVAGRRFAKLDVTVRQSFYQRGETLSPEQGWRRIRQRIVDLMRYARMKESAKYVLLGYAKCCGLGFQIARKTGDASIALKALCLSTSCLVSAG